MDSRRTWILPERALSVGPRVEEIRAAFDLPTPIARLLVQRGFEDPAAVAEFLEPSLDQLPDPLRMADMQRAVQRLVHAIEHEEHIVINGDYDADGVTGTALLVSELGRLGARVDFFIPDRERDGYGITPRLVRRAAEVGVRILISVDCGSSDHEAIDEARALGIDVLVVDHHDIPEVPGSAFAVLNPKRADCPYPFKGLSAVGVAYKLLQAVCVQVRGRSAPEDGLDFVAIGTLADVQPVLQENRVLTALGLRRLGTAPRPGIGALRDLAGVGGDNLRSGQVGFKLAPRLNAVGRVARGKLAVDLLLARDDRQARALAHEVEGQNELRRQLQQRVIAEALELAEKQLRARECAALVFASAEWHPGVLGIAAARLAETHALPAALIGIQNGQGRGSVRSAGEVDVRAALSEVSDSLVKFGGHRQAAGFSIEPARIQDFAAAFEGAVRARRETTGDQRLHIDAELESTDLGLELLRGLDLLEPYGVGNPEPLFVLSGVTVGERTRIVGGEHLKLDLRFADGRPLDGIAFRWGRDLQPAEILGRQLDLVGHLRRQDPRYGADCQLVVSDLRSHPRVQH